MCQLTIDDARNVDAAETLKARWEEMRPDVLNVEFTGTATIVVAIRRGIIEDARLARESTTR